MTCCRDIIIHEAHLYLQPMFFFGVNVIYNLCCLYLIGYGLYTFDLNFSFYH